MHQHILVKMKHPRIVKVDYDDGSINRETHWEAMTVTVPDRGNIFEIESWFKAAYPEAVILEIVHEVITDEKGKNHEP